MYRKLFFVGSGIFVGMFLLWSVQGKSSSPIGDELPTRFHGVDTIELCLHDKCICSDIARTESERSQGLSGRKALRDDEGLFFIFPHLAKQGIWMKDMHFSIDIIWFDSELRVVDVVQSATPESYPHVFLPREKSLYVLEVPAGWIAIGESIWGESLSVSPCHR